MDKVFNQLKRFFKELKRVRWPDGSGASKTFLTTTIFIIITSLLLFLVAFGFTEMWTFWGVGISG